MRDAQRYDLDPDPRSRSPGPESCKINQITPSGITSQSAAKFGFCYTKWDFRHKFVRINIFGILFNQKKRKIKRILADVCR